MPQPWLSAALGCILIHSAAFAAPLDDFAQSKAWLRLLHLEPRLISGFESTSGAKDFFLSGQNRDPKIELDATIRAFTTDARDVAENPQCIFPARKRLLARALDLKFAGSPKCRAFQNFHDNLDAHGVAVVFSTYYLNNPSSAFGHSFLRLSKVAAGSPRERYELLDTGVSFAGDPTTKNPVLYALYGALGYFPGTWTSLPYFYKVHEYNDADSRDLWSYDLAFAPAQIEDLVAHLWELGHSHMPYFYFTRNCSYEILAALEAARPDLDLIGPLRAITVPVDTLQVLTRAPGLVTGRSYRPSLRTQLRERYRQTREPATAVNAVRERDLRDLPTDPVARAEALDLAIDIMEFASRADPPNKIDPFKQKLFLERSRLAVVTPKQNITPEPEDAPDRAHGSRMAAVAQGANSDSQNFTELRYRFALHEFADPAAGYPGSSELAMGDFTARFDWARHRFALEESQLFHVTSLAAWDALDRPVSWELGLGSTTVRDDRCPECFAPRLEGGAGVTLARGRHFLTALLGKTRIEASDAFAGGFFQFAAGPEFIAVLRPSPRWQFVLRSEYDYNFRRAYSYDWCSTFSGQLNLNRSLGLRVTSRALVNRVHGDQTESKLGLLYYF